MIVGKVNAPLKAHFEKVGETMANEWSQKAGSRGAAVLASYKSFQFKIKATYISLVALNFYVKINK